MVVGFVYVDGSGEETEGSEVKQVSARDLRPGDVIHEGKKVTPVQSLGRGESCNGMHVNGNLCYDRASTVMVTR